MRPYGRGSGNWKPSCPRKPTEDNRPPAWNHRWLNGLKSGWGLADREARSQP